MFVTRLSFAVVGLLSLPTVAYADTFGSGENRFEIDDKRQVNIDPGYLSAERFVLATGKNYTHRIYLSKGIFADLTLIFTKGNFHTLPWTYPDYADLRMIRFLKIVREKYLLDLKHSLSMGSK